MNSHKTYDRTRLLILISLAVTIVGVLCIGALHSQEGATDRKTEAPTSQRAPRPRIAKSKKPLSPSLVTSKNPLFAAKSAPPRPFDPANALKTTYAFPQHRQQEFRALADSEGTVKLAEHPSVSVRLSIADPTNGFDKEQACRKKYRLRKDQGSCGFSLRVVSSSKDGVSGTIVYAQALSTYAGKELSPACKNYAMCFAKAQMSKKVIASKPGLSALELSSVMHPEFDMNCDQQRLDQEIKTLQDDLQAFAKMPVADQANKPRRDLLFAAGQQEQIIEYYRLIKQDCQ